MILKSKDKAFQQVPSFIPPNCLESPSLQGCHDDVYIIVPISQHAFLVRRHHSAWRKSEKIEKNRSSATVDTQM